MNQGSRFDLSRIVTGILLCSVGLSAWTQESESNLESFYASPVWTPADTFLHTLNGEGELAWPGETAEARPGSYWWWPGSAVTKSDLTWNLETYHKAGWGNLGVIGIYGVQGEEAASIDIFSPKWFDMFNHSLKEADRLGMNLDLTPSSGWRLGGPHVTPEYAEQSYAIENGQIKVVQRTDMVKRAGAGGQGYCINPYSESAVQFHFNWLSERFLAGKGRSPRAFYYDSFENPGNWSPEFPEEFKRLRGYELKDHAKALGGAGDSETSRRIVCDYRETLSDVLISRVDQIKAWCDYRESALRMQAHGAPANLLDMYAAAGIPETEVFGANHFDIQGYRRDSLGARPDPHSILVNRFASSAAHVSGKDLIISESFTWLRNHYHTALSHIKAEADLLLLSGINGIYYHGSCYAPQKTNYPGWLFYASTQVNYRNTIFRDIPQLNAYLTRCQSILQAGKPHNDILLYWPVYDQWMSGGEGELRFRVHNPQWIDSTTCGKAASWMLKQGYTFDFISDRQILNISLDGSELLTGGGTTYQTILIPDAEYMNPATLDHLIKLASQGARILIWGSPPRKVPGWFDFKQREEVLHKLIGNLGLDSDGSVQVGSGQIVVDHDLDLLLQVAKIKREKLVDQNLQFIRRENRDHISYFISNHSDHAVDTLVSFSVPFSGSVIMDPMTGRSGVAPAIAKGAESAIYLQMESGESRIVRLYSRELSGDPWPALQASGEPVPVNGGWNLTFSEGGPLFPEESTIKALESWTDLGSPAMESFAGSGVYTTSVTLSDLRADSWILDLGDVRESARIWVNLQPAGILVAHPYRIDVSPYLQDGINELTIEVSNLSANRIRDLDRRGVPWKKFEDINIVSHMYEPFDASDWPLQPSGLLGPVYLIPYDLLQ